MTAIGDPVGHSAAAAAAATAAAARAAATVRRPAADATAGQGAPGDDHAPRGVPLVPRSTSGAPDPSGQSGRLVDVFA